MKKTCGIYAIKNKISGKAYVGQSVFVEGRKNSHFHSLRMGNHDSVHLQRAFIKDGADAFEHVILEICKQDELTNREQFWMDLIRPYGIYNLAPAAGSNFGFKHSIEARKRMSAAQKLRTATPETKLKMSIARRGRKKPESFSIKMSLVHKGKQIPDETRKKISESLKGNIPHNKGDKASAETLLKLSAAQKASWARRKANK